MAGDWAVDMYERGEDLVVEVGLPGMRFEDVSVMALGSRLVISAHAQDERGVRRYHLRGSRVRRDFTHEVTLPAQARLELASATYAHGLLRVGIPLGPDDTKTGRLIPRHDAAALRDGGGSRRCGGWSMGAAPSPTRAFRRRPTQRWRGAAPGGRVDGEVGGQRPLPSTTRFSYGPCDACWR